MSEKLLLSAWLSLYLLSPHCGRNSGGSKRTRQLELPVGFWELLLSWAHRIYFMHDGMHAARCRVVDNELPEQPQTYLFAPTLVSDSVLIAKPRFVCGLWFLFLLLSELTYQAPNSQSMQPMQSQSAMQIDLRALAHRMLLRCACVCQGRGSSGAIQFTPMLASSRLHAELSV